MPEPGSLETAELFRTARPKLTRLAYRYLGSVSDAEDIVQDAFLKYSQAEGIANPQGWLSRVVTNASLDRLRQLKKSRESYVGPWLPEPVTDPEIGSASDKELDISFAVMRTLETLSPPERACLFLHDLFEQPFEMIAETLNRTPASCRQLASRARKAIRTGGPRFQASEDDLKRFVDILSQASLANDPSILLPVLSPSADLASDGGGKVSAALNVVKGGLSVAKFLVGVVRKNLGRNLGVEPVNVNGGMGLIVRLDQSIDSIVSFDLTADGLIRSVYIVRNPDKLQRISDTHIINKGVAAG